MAIDDDFRCVADDVRAIPGLLGLRPYTVEIELRSWDGAERGNGNLTETLELVTVGGYPPKVHFMQDEELALAGFERGAIRIGPITPSFTSGSETGGVELATLLADPGANGTARVKVTGPRYPEGAYFRIRNVDAGKALTYYIEATRMGGE